MNRVPSRGDAVAGMRPTTRVRARPSGADQSSGADRGALDALRAGLPVEALPGVAALAGARGRVGDAGRDTAGTGSSGRPSAGVGATGVAEERARRGRGAASGGRRARVGSGSTPAPRAGRPRAAQRPSRAVGRTAVAPTSLGRFARAARALDRPSAALVRLPRAADARRAAPAHRPAVLHPHEHRVGRHLVGDDGARLPVDLDAPPTPGTSRAKSA